MSFNYITKEDKTKELFFKMPKQFIYEKTYKKMNDSAKILYSILYERTNLSIKNDWFDSDDRAYIICTYDEIQTLFGCSRDKVSRCMKELVKYNLILKDKVKSKNGDMVNVLYIANAETTSETISVLMDQHKNEYHKLRDKNRAYKRDYNKKQSELKKKIRESEMESEKQTTIGNTSSRNIKLLKPSNCNGSLKNRLRVVRKSDYSNTDFSNTDLKSVVVVINGVEKEMTEEYKIQIDENKNTQEKINSLKEIVFINEYTEALLYKFIDFNILLTKSQIKMLNDCVYEIALKSIDETIAKTGQTFSYFYEIYKAREKEDIDNLVADCMFIPNFKDTESKETVKENLDFREDYYEKCKLNNWNEESEITIKIAIEYAKEKGLEYPQDLDKNNK